MPTINSFAKNMPVGRLFIPNIFGATPWPLQALIQATPLFIIFLYWSNLAFDRKTRTGSGEKLERRLSESQNPGSPLTEHCLYCIAD